MRVVVSVMHDAALGVEHIPAAEPNPITHPERNTIRHIEIVGDQERLAAGNSDDKALVLLIITIVRQ